ncbi:DUF4278 domain-containing protein [Coleofasciculus sp. H7-2]|uniref:arginine synthesis PII-interacting regulator PirA n=1 Tax=Coleofasciculus sp. H7-2 TaxID=3351545 RepID=UPI00366BE3E4
MKLSYRGVSYEKTSPTLEVTESEIVGKYRGQTYNIAYPRHIVVPDAIVNLNYRGVPYFIGKTGTTRDALQRQNFLSEGMAPLSDRKLPTDTNRQKVLDNAAKSHLANIHRSLEHRLQVAKAKGDENLIRLLEAESKQLTLCL